MMCRYFHRVVYMGIIYICYQVLMSMVQLTNTCMPDLHYGKHLVGSTFMITEKSSLFSCAAECVSHGICKSFNFQSDQRVCHLNIFDGIQYLEGGKDLNYIYSSITRWNKTALGPCHENTCGYTQRCNIKRNGIVDCEDYLASVAKGKTTNASSYFRNSPSSVAVDGDINAVWSVGSCFAVANGDHSPWWQVDLAVIYAIVEVRVTSRQDCCPQRLHDFALDVYHVDPLVDPTASSQLCYMYNGAVTQPGKTVAIQCTSTVIGRYLRISGKKTMNNQDILQFCEVQVFGVKLCGHLTSQQPSDLYSSQTFRIQIQ
ncbi:uncharacterized protein [Haliotis asinina]|uniref:uncharacterized protein n=1 Tax=Haliotis asinina TaxID=109174 RepID=UPI003531DC6C